MVEMNVGICHSCRSKSQYFVECPRKCRCPSCKHGFKKCFVVEKETANKGRLFLCCIDNCDFWDWVVKEESSNESSSGSTSSVNQSMAERVDDMFQSSIRVNDEVDL